MAYYHFRVKQDINMAKKYVEEGLAGIEKFGLLGAEREMERKLLVELDEMITDKVIKNERDVNLI